MKNQNDSNFNLDSNLAKLEDKDFIRLSEFITREFGIEMPDIKKVMLQSRLQKRLKKLNLNSFSDYVNYLFSKQGMEEEMIHFVDVISTNRTEFFRENLHFDFLLNTLLPDLCPPGSKEHLKFWSVGCSSGEEPYTLAIVLSEFQEKHSLADFIIYATDISTRILQKAYQAIYKEEQINNIPQGLKSKYFLRSIDKEERKVQVVPELRDKVIFSRLNLIDDYYSTPFIFDIVFCRNVLIYFDRTVQEKIIFKLCSSIRSGGYLFLGHSESIAGMNLPLRHIQPTVFMKP
ncbi:MAG: hypothetical protein JW973_09790 [Bacteroidales bacterium]|nr:hypothetical protein [Bacteroidales bacterium]